MALQPEYVQVTGAEEYEMAKPGGAESKPHSVSESKTFFWKSEHKITTLLRRNNLLLLWQKISIAVMILQ